MIGLIVAAVFIGYILLIIFMPVVALSILALILFVLLLVLLIPIGLDSKYLNNEFSLSIKIAFYSHKLFPKSKETESSKPDAPAEKEPQAEAAAEKKENIVKKLQLNFEEILEILKKAVNSLGKFGKLTVDKFTLHYIAAGKDPYSTAMTYNYVNMALSSLAPCSAKAFRINGDVDVWTDIDFTREKMLIDAELCITLKLIQVVHVALVAGFGIACVLVRNRLRIAKEKLKERKQTKCLNDSNIKIENSEKIQTEERTDSNG